ncbi:phosphatase PAP2 family protein [Fictibacillus barbaricus]|uniref:Phosphatase PAP2 family protein n=1 Tax=Fictibacillus barbaricus TaxID=182136 RepID=A0ABS2ZIF3_9BACL|nr:phosphatase PAP2 family protein [Fictibacillus barbaricus]MBN3547740.1 phosphatase PAP2 family protein [Fictibacillus barbaricus]GGB51197.1 phosphatidylglycerophosphatase B [Fictibacillus barbaricus]
MSEKTSVIRTVMLIAVLFGVFILFASFYKQTTVNGLDVYAMQNVSVIHHPTLSEFFTSITNAASRPYQYAIYIFFTVIWLVVERKWIEPLVLGICLFGIRFENQWFKSLFERDRPMFDRVIEINGYSFPSGHAMISIAFFGFLAYLLVQNYSLMRSFKKIIYWLTAIFVVLVGFSRVYLGVHYPTDVLGGFAAGGTWLLICVLLYKMLVGLVKRKVHG